MNDPQRQAIFVFSTSFLPFQGGAEIAVDQISKRVLAHDFIVLTSRQSRRVNKYEKRGNLEIYRLGMGFGLDKYILPILSYLKAKKLIRKKKHSSMLWGIMISYGSIGAYLLKKRYSGIPLLITLQEGDSVTHIKNSKGGLINYFWRKILSVSDEVQAISRHLANLATSYGFKRDVHVIPNGVDIERLSKKVSEEDKNEAFNKTGIIRGDKTVISVSRLVKKNGISDLIKAVSKLPDIKLVLLGEGALKKELKDLSSELNIAGRVIFMGDIRHEEVRKYLSISDVFVRPSLSEGLGNAFLESMASGVPIIATEVGGIRDFLIDGETGIAVNISDPEGLANSIKNLLDEKELYKKIQKNGIKLVNEKYNWDNIAKDMNHVFNDLIKKRES